MKNTESLPVVCVAKRPSRISTSVEAAAPALVFVRHGRGLQPLPTPIAQVICGNHSPLS
jgi:hypothetical protein